MTQNERRHFMLEYLISDLPPIQQEKVNVPKNIGQQRLLLRTLLNARETPVTDQRYLEIQNKYLKELIEERGIVDIADIIPLYKDVCVYQGDITSIKCDAIVCPVDENLKGISHPYNNKLDNSIHAFVGEQIKSECLQYNQTNPPPHSVNTTVITPAYNLPCEYVIHCVFPNWQEVAETTLVENVTETLTSCLQCAEKHKLRSIAFTKSSIGKQRYFSRMPIKMSLDAIYAYKKKTQSNIKILFCTDQHETTEIFNALMQHDKKTSSYRY